MQAMGNMMTLALIQGAVNTFVIFLSRVIGYMVDKSVSSGLKRLFMTHPPLQERIAALKVGQ